MKKILYVIFCCLFMTAVFTGCGGNEKSASGAAKHLNLGLYWFGESMDPAHEWDGWTMVRIGAGETLVTVTDKMEFKGQLADKWENVDPTTWKFHIREKVKFQNGDDMTPELVKASLDRTLKMNAIVKKSADIKEIRVEGQNIIIETNKPNVSLLAAMTEPAFSIIDTKADMDKAASTPVLTGPYMVTGFTKNQEVKLKRNEYYWDGKPGLDTLTVKNIEDNTKRAMSLQSGELDLMQRVDSASRSLFENDKYKIYETVGTRVFMLTVNYDGILADRSLRRALAYAVDYEALAKIEGNGAVAAGEIFPPTVPYGHVKNKMKMDMDKAESLFKEAGYTEKNGEGIYVKDGRPLTLKLAVWGSKTAMYEAIQAQLRKAGVNVEIMRVQNADAAVAAGGFDLLEQNWITVPTNDPYLFVNQVFRSGHKANRGKYVNADVDQILDRYPMVFDNKEKDGMISEIAEKVIADAPVLFLAFPANNLVGASKVKNVPVFPIDYYVMTKDITVE